MQLVGMLDSPYVRRVAVALLTADAPFRHKPLSLFRHIPDFSKLSPLLKAPSLVLEDKTTLVDSGLILEYLATQFPAVAKLMPAASATPVTAVRLTGVALTVCEKAVQIHYERALRKPEERSETWMQRVSRQLHVGLEALERELPHSGWISGAQINLADISVVCALGFVTGAIGDAVDVSPYPCALAFAARGEALPAFRRAPAIDGVTAPVD